MVDGSTSVIDPATWKVIKKITFEVPGVRPELLQPVGMNFTKHGKLLFVALGPANRSSAFVIVCPFFGWNQTQ